MRLELRVTLWLAVLLGLSAALALFLMARFESQRLEDQWTEAGLAMAQATEDTLEVSMLNDAPQDIRQAVRNVQEGELVEGVSVYGIDGEAWVQSDVSVEHSEIRHDALMSAMRDNAPATATEADSLSVFVPVEKSPGCMPCHAESGDVLGAVEVRLDEAPLRAELAKSARASLVVAALPLLFGLFFSVSAIRRSVLEPLSELDDAAERLGDGDLSVRLPRYRDPEFGEVAETFNDMASRLEHQAVDLRSTVDLLRSEMTVMDQIRAMLTEGAGLSEVLQRAAAHLGSALEASGVAIWEDAHREPSAEWGARLQEAVTTQRTAAEGRSHSSGGFLAEVPEEALLTWVTVPARARGAVLGVVGVGWDPPKPVLRSERDLLEALAGLVGIAIDNATLLDDLQRKEDSMQALVRKTLTAQEEERKRIARELHDETSQVLSALLMNISMLESHAPQDADGRARVEAVKNLAEEAARNLDAMLFDLRPALLDELGLIPALRWYLAQIADAWGVAIAFEGGKTGRLPDHVEVTAFRIVQEAVGNVVRHAKAASATVRVASDEEGWLIVSVTDDGIGFDTRSIAGRARTGESVGLMGMRERAEIIGGALSIESSPGMGATIVARLPVTDAEAAETPTQTDEPEGTVR
jgi:signal transduction histidine kinase